MAVLQRMVTAAIDRSPQLRESNAAARAAQMDTEQAKGARWPRVEVSAASTAVSVGGGNANGDGSVGRVGLTATYTLFDAGVNSSQIKAHEFTERSMTAKVSQTRETVAFDTVNVYLQIIKQQKIIDLFKAHIERLTLLVSKLEEIVKVFAGRRSELTQANARLGQARDAQDALFVDTPVSLW